MVAWVYDVFKSCVPYSDRERIYKIPLMSVIKHLPSNKFNTFLNMLEHYENSIKLKLKKEETKEEAIAIIKDKIHEKEYIPFTVARYALTDVIEELNKSNAKDIIVTKEDDNLVVKYKPYWKK